MAATVAVACGRRSPADEPPAPLPQSQELAASPRASASSSSSSSSSAGASGPKKLPIDADLEEITGADAASPRVQALLGRLGFAGKDLPGKDGDGLPRKVEAASRMARQLDDDPELESIVQVLVKATPSTTLRVTELHLAWFDGGEGPEPKLLGQRRFALRTCTYEPTISVEARRVHGETASDTVIEWEAISTCDGHAGSAGVAVVAVDRGRVETIFQLDDPFAFAPRSGQILDPKAIVRFEGAEIVIEEEGKPIRRLAFDPVAYKYR
jgi:hypothetical protein